VQKGRTNELTNQRYKEITNDNTKYIKK